MQINKNTTTSYASQRERDGGMVSQGIGKENIQTLEPMGKMQMYKEEPIQLSTNHFVFCAQSSRSWLGKVNARAWEEYGSQIKI